MEIKNIYLKDKMKIGVIGISGKGKTTLLNHLIDKDIANVLKELEGPTHKETEMTGQNKNPVRYCIKRNLIDYSSKISQFEDGKCEEFKIEISKAAQYAKSANKCTVTIETRPSEEFDKIMMQYNLTELEFIDTQGLLDTLEQEVTVPYEIKECAFLLYLYDVSDQGSRGDYINKYRNFLNGISDKPLIFLETSIQWQLKKNQLECLAKIAQSELEELDTNFSTLPEDIRKRYTILTGNNEYKNNDTFILTSILGASESAVNFYEVKIPNDKKEQYSDQCLRICATHTMKRVFERLSGFKESLKSEFDKANANFDYSVAFEACYGLLQDVFVNQWQRIDYSTNTKVLRHARHNYDQFKQVLITLQNGCLFYTDFNKIDCEIHTSYGYHRVFETYENQNILDCMQLLLDLYIGYLKKITTDGNKLSKAVQVYLEKSISTDLMCRDTIYDIPVLSEETFKYCLNELEQWIGNISVENVVFAKFDQLDINYPNKQLILRSCKRYIPNTDSLITKLIYLCKIINKKVYNLAKDTMLDKASEFIVK